MNLDAAPQMRFLDGRLRFGDSMAEVAQILKIVYLI